jgi:iron complex transport system ATP-binding protein
VSLLPPRVREWWRRRTRGSEPEPGPDPAPDAAVDAPAVAVRGLAVDRGGARVLRRLSATVERGRFVGLVGPNGAGKTTLLWTLAGALDPVAGEVRVLGERVHDLPSRAGSRLVAVVPQEPSFGFEFTVREAVAMGRTPHQSRLRGETAADRAAVDAAMERVAVADLADRSVTAVSGGERSRVLLARALAQDTPVVLLDEPTASLDVNHQVRTLDAVRDLVAEGRTVVAAIHDLTLAARYCDDLLLLAGGRVRASGAPGEVLTAERVHEAFDADAVVPDHPVTGTPLVTALGSRERRPDAGDRSGGGERGVRGERAERTAEDD